MQTLGACRKCNSSATAAPVTDAFGDSTQAVLDAMAETRSLMVGREHVLRPRPEMRKDVREFIRRLEAVGLTVESTPGHYRVLREGKPLRKRNGMPFTLPFSPDTTRWRRAAIVELRKLGIDL